LLFASVIFILFFLPIVTIFYWLRRDIPYRNMMLLVASMIFYFWGETWQIAILLGTVIFNYFMALFIGGEERPTPRKVKLLLGVVGNLSILVYFKYSAFFADGLNQFFSLIPMQARLPVVAHHLPLGISFFVFHAISYLIDTYRRVVKAEPKASTVGLYFFLFPHQIAGPIVRYDLFARQVYARKTDESDLVIGIERFILGLMKKVLIANSVATAADHVFGLAPANLSMPLAWLGVLSYTLQIYYDFSGYSDMAIGLARMFGFHFHENFNYPYRAQSVTDFWRRWHISLSTWFRDYLYIPLGGNRAGPFRTYFNLSLVFLLCGLWHGANWTFVIWGAWHGFLLILERAGLGKFIEKHRIFGTTWTILTVMLGWVFFRAESVPQALHFIERMVSFKMQSGDSFFHTALLMSDHLMLFGVLMGVLFATGHAYVWIKRNSEHAGVRNYGYSFLLILFFILSVSRLADSTFNPFIYFRF
jgi:alginate O-acetyltransferase complex protein AlgI